MFLVFNFFCSLRLNTTKSLFFPYTLSLSLSLSLCLIFLSISLLVHPPFSCRVSHSIIECSILSSAMVEGRRRSGKYLRNGSIHCGRSNVKVTLSCHQLAAETCHRHFSLNFVAAENRQNKEFFINNKV